MLFEKPDILFFLLFLIIPVLIHMLNLKKYKKIYFSNIELIEKVTSKKKKISRLKDFLLLLTRLLVLSSIIIAFSKPYFAKEKIIDRKINKVSFYIDNSLSMSTGDKNILIKEAKKNAEFLIKKLNNNVKVNVITNDLDFFSNKFISKKESLELIKEIKISPFQLSICEIINRQNRLLENDSLSNNFIISDFQKNFSKKYKNCKEKINEAKLVQIKSNQTNNIGVKSCEFTSPFRKKNQEENLIVEIQNYSTKNKKNILVELFINNKKRGFNNIDIEGKSTIKINFPFTNLETGKVNGKLQISNDDFVFDNSLFFTYEIKDNLNVLLIYENEPNSSIEAVFSDSLFNLEINNKDQINFEKIKNYDLIILNDLKNIQKSLVDYLKKSLENGKNIFLFPNENIDMKSYNYAMRELKGDEIIKLSKDVIELNKINFEHLIFENVFKRTKKNIQLPKTSANFKINTKNLNQRNNILNFANNDPYLLEYKNFKGSFYFCTSPLAKSSNNLTKNAIFLPIMYNSTFSSKSSKLYEIIERNLILNCDECEPGSLTYLKKNEEFEIALEGSLINKSTYLSINNKIKEEGTYNLFSNENLNKNISFNYNREEGELNSTFFTNIESKSINQLTDFNKFNTNKNNKKKNLIFYFIFIGLISFLFETLLLKLWKN
tara:strand:+ start:11255 stop:13243 length:1989 start_codon:yes stop_codon:yes gene_type:complete